MTFEQWTKTEAAREAVMILMSKGSVTAADALVAMRAAWDAALLDVSAYMGYRTPSTHAYEDAQRYMGRMFQHRTASRNL